MPLEYFWIIYSYHFQINSRHSFFEVTSPQKKHYTTRIQKSNSKIDCNVVEKTPPPPRVRTIMSSGVSSSSGTSTSSCWQQSHSSSVGKSQSSAICLSNVILSLFLPREHGSKVFQRNVLQLGRVAALNDAELLLTEINWNCSSIIRKQSLGHEIGMTLPVEKKMSVQSIGTSTRVVVHQQEPASCCTWSVLIRVKQKPVNTQQQLCRI